MVPKLKTGVMVRIFSILYRKLVIQTVFQFQAWRCRRAKQYLLRHDPDYRRQYAGREIVRRRSVLYSEGVSALDSSVPELQDMEDEMPPLAWPRRKQSF